MKNTRYLLGFDFGDGETVATFFDGEKSTHCYFDRAQHQKLYSHVFRTGEDYSLTSGDTLLINLKKRLLHAHKKIANKNDARILQAEADFKGFVRCVVDAVLKNNAININDCVLLYAYPSSFYASSEKQNKELESIYKSIIESVLMDFKPKEIRSVDEAEASFYCKGSSERNCLVIDAGSSTLDFALFVHGEKVALTSVQNSSLGASVIEENLYNYFLTNGTFAEDARKIESAYSVNLHNYFVRILRERKEKAYITGQFLKLGSYELYTDLPIIDPNYNSDFSFKLKDDFNLLPSVVTYQEKVHDAIVKAKCEAESVKEINGQMVDQVLLCGGAALMGWLQDDVREIFSDNVDIQHLDASDLQHDPSFTVSDGLITYSKVACAPSSLFEYKYEVYINGERKKIGTFLKDIPFPIEEYSVRIFHDTSWIFKSHFILMVKLYRLDCDNEILVFDHSQSVDNYDSCSSSDYELDVSIKACQKNAMSDISFRISYACTKTYDNDDRRSGWDWDTPGFWIGY